MNAWIPQGAPMCKDLLSLVRATRQTGSGPSSVAPSPDRVSLPASFKATRISSGSAS